jgi:signal peptidase II
MLAKFKLPLLFCTLVLVDQLMKFIVLKYFSDISVLNSGGGFSISVGNINFIYVSLLCLAAFIVLLRIFNKSAFQTPAFVLILAGTLSNVADRVFRGGVVDFIHTPIWPTFNIADSCIVIGAALLIINELRAKRSS